MRKLVLFFFLTALSFGQSTLKTAVSAAEHPSEATRLPVKRVVLFKNGVGYFEHLGPVSGTQSVSIDFTTSQLNDVLKSLTVIDLGHGRIAGVNYTSVEPLERQLGSLRMGLAENITAGQFLAAIKGAHVEIRSGNTVVNGRVLSVETHDVFHKADANTTYKLDYISIITDNGEFRQFELSPTLGVRLLEGDMRDDVGRYLSVLASGREQDLRRMVINTAGDGHRELEVSYISEVPVWKSTYRLVLPKDGTKPFIQGWAIVDNTVGEDWKDIELSLVAGAPQSFVEELSKPTYARRPEVGLPETAMLQPQTHEAAIQNQNRATGANENVTVSDQVQSLNTSSEMIAATENAAVGAVHKHKDVSTIGAMAGGVIGGVVRTPAPPPPAISAPMAYDKLEQYSKLMSPPMMAAAAYGNDIGDLFEYRLKDRVTIRKNQSAMVPIIQENVEAEKVTIWNEREPRPLRAVWMKNTSTETLDAGTFNILEDDTFAGEGIMDPIKPGERRLLSYAVDQGITVESKNESGTNHVTQVVIKNGTMWQTNQVRAHKVYVIHNANTDGRDVVIEHAIQPNWKLVSDVKADETTATHRRFKVHVGPKESVSLNVEEAYPISSTYALTNISTDDIELFLKAQSISPEVEKELRKVLAKKDAVAEIQRQISTREDEQSTINEDQARLRENLKALKGSAEERELIQRYTHLLNTQEDTLDRLKKELTNLDAQQDSAEQELKKTIDDLTMNVAI